MKSLSFPYNKESYAAFTEHWHVHMDALSCAMGCHPKDHHVHATRESPHMNIATLHEYEPRLGEEQATYDARIAALVADDHARALKKMGPRLHDGYAEVTLDYDDENDAERVLADEFVKAFKGV